MSGREPAASLVAFSEAVEVPNGHDFHVSPGGAGAVWEAQGVGNSGNLTTLGDNGDYLAWMTTSTEYNFHIAISKLDESGVASLAS